VATSLTRFRVSGLHGRKTVDVWIEDNRLVLVGENGTGKSTVANLIYYFLTRQWERIREHRFKEISADLNGRTVSVTPELVEQHIHRSNIRGTSHFSRELFLRLNRIFDRLPAPRLEEILSNPDLQRAYARDAGISQRIVIDWLSSYLHEKKEPSELEKVSEDISSTVSEQFLYLPTYRRIEHDLQSIFRGGEIDVDELRKSLVGGSSEAYVELVHFGMEDVAQKIQARLGQLEKSFRSGLSKLTGTYLHDVIQGVYQDVSFDSLRNIDLPLLDSMLARIPDETLPPGDKSYLKEKVGRFAVASYGQGDNVIAHFLQKLLELNREQQELERDFQEFLNVCNGYLTDKKLTFDNKRFEMAITLSGTGPTIEDKHEELRLRMLSSGEKQIVSLFSHIYLSTERRFFLIIDEPELSLSVAWQRRFLPDILKTTRCDGLIAVTHSPFIWQNELDRYVQSLPELTITSDDVR